jgi:2-amino-4-hydroxy-6-hydroxymethyldihydropteridine diphosphokinase
MDLDVLLFGNQIGVTPQVTLPRPDLLKRAFMLGPLAEIAPRLQHPVSGLTMAELWAQFDRDAHPLLRIELDLASA